MDNERWGIFSAGFGIALMIGFGGCYIRGCNEDSRQKAAVDKVQLEEGKKINDLHAENKAVRGKFDDSQKDLFGCQAKLKGAEEKVIRIEYDMNTLKSSCHKELNDFREELTVIKDNFIGREDKVRKDKLVLDKREAALEEREEVVRVFEKEKAVLDKKKTKK